MASFRNLPRPAPHRSKGPSSVVSSYVADRSNVCPACSHSNWWVGRYSAECGFCGTALPIAGAAHTATEYKQRAA